MSEEKMPKPNLVPEEEKELRAGQDIYEMSQSAGWKHIRTWLEDLSFHSWVDPREVESRKIWEWRELNAFHASNNAKELLERVQKAISQSEYLEKVKSGEFKRRPMKI